MARQVKGSSQALLTFMTIPAADFVYDSAMAGQDGQRAVYPASTINGVPVMNEASSEARKRIA